MIAKRLNWEVEGEPLGVRPGDEESAAAELAPGESATQTITLPPGPWDLSFQYASEVVPLRVQAGDLGSEMPPESRARSPSVPTRGPIWPVGAGQSDGGPVEITVTAGEVSGLQKALGVDAPAAIGNIAATRLDEIGTNPIQPRLRARYLDHYYLGAPGALQVSRESGGEVGRPDPEPLAAADGRAARRSAPRAASGRRRARRPAPAPRRRPRRRPAAAPAPRRRPAAGRAHSRPRTRD